MRRAESGGACFFFSVCLQTPTAAEIQTQMQSPLLNVSEHFKSKWAPRQARLLIVEDSLENRLLIQAYLRKQPLELHFAHNGQEALDFCATSLPDLILMDIQMPVMDGLTATREIRKRYDTPVKIIVLSADALVQTRERAILAGADSFLTKPVSRDKLLKTIDYFLSDPNPDPEQVPHPIPSPDSVDPVDRLLSDMPAFELIEELADLLPVFFAVRQEESQILNEALTQEDWATIKKIGHRLQGASETYGFPYFSEIGRALESSKDMSVLRHWVERFDTYLAWVTHQLQDQISPGDASSVTPPNS